MPKYIHVPRPTGEKKYIPAPRPTGEPKYIPAPRPKNNSEYIPAPRPKGEPKYVPAPRPAKKGEYVHVPRPDYIQVGRQQLEKIPNNTEIQTTIELSNFPIIHDNLPVFANNNQLIVTEANNEQIVFKYGNYGSGFQYRIPKRKPVVSIRSIPKRGEDYPNFYHGFVNNTSICIYKNVNGSGHKCNIIFGPNFLKQYAIVHNHDITNVFKGECLFYYDGNNVNKSIWPNDLDTNIFDYIGIQAVGESLDLAGITITLNGITLLDVNIEKNIKCGEVFDISGLLLLSRTSLVPYAMLHPVTGYAAMDYGKCWGWQYRFRYGIGPLTLPDGKTFWSLLPEDWCSEFVVYVVKRASNGRIDIRDALGLQDINGGVGHRDLIRYFGNNFITPSNCNWNQIGKKMKAGMYVRINSWKGGENGPLYQVDEKIGHSTIFLTWCDLNNNPCDFNVNSNTNYFLAIGGSQGSDHLVCYKRYSINHNDFDNDFNIIWSRDAKNFYGEYDGFGEIEL